ISSSLPLDRAGRLRRDVVDDAVHAAHLAHDAAGSAVEEIVRQAGPVGGHEVFGRDRPQRDSALVGTAVAHDAYALHGQQHRERLRGPLVEAARTQLLEKDRVGLLQDPHALLCDLTGDAHGEAGARERMAREHLLRNTELLAEASHLVLEELAERLEQAEPELLGQGAHVVVRLDERRWSLYRKGP